ncbi:ribonuclease P protein subunit p20 [Phlyctochytrium arcticum]|nr:ribonuclease P protein subunit p20 [Phlyctochytrium arcticum]
MPKTARERVPTPSEPPDSTLPLKPARHKRAPQRAPTLANDIYVSRKSNFIGLLKRGQKILDDEQYTTLTIHGLGAAMKRAIELALRLKEDNLDRISWTIETSTVNLVDDVEPEDVDDDLVSETRQNSSIHICIRKISHVF